MTSSQEEPERRILSTSPAPPIMSPLTPANGEENGNGDTEPPTATPVAQTARPEILATPEHNNAAFSHAASDLFPQNGAVPSNMGLMMALAQLSSRLSAVSTPNPPPTVAPAQVSLPRPHHLDGLPEGPLLAHARNGHGHSLGNGHPHPPPDAPLESFARIEFADSVFQMTTYAVVIGRDQRALEQARRDERRADEYQRKVEESAAAGLPPPSPPSQEPGKFSKSYVSEEGGMLGPESDGDGRPAKRRKTSTGGSGSGAAQQQQQPEPVEAAEEESQNPDLIINRQYVCHTPGAAAVDLTSLRPSPYHVPFIGIHSPGPGIAGKTKAISREHLKIQFNQEQGVFEAIPLHKNGFFCEDVHYKETRVVLRSGDRLQIKDIDFVFVINGVQRGKTGAEEYLDEDESAAVGKINKRYSEGGKEMSFEFESSHGGDVQVTSDEEEEGDEEDDEDEEAAKQESDSELSDPEDENAVMETIEGGDAEGQQQQQGIKAELNSDLSLPPDLPKKRGPGRPPKNGIMSKREERLRKKMAVELAKKSLPPPPPPGEPPVKRKVGRPRKHPRPEDGSSDRPDKRKYKPRKPKAAKEGSGEGAAGGGGAGSDGEKTTPKEKRREKPKTPPLELKKEEFSEEQLQKPNKNYGVLIDEVLTEAAGDGLTLKQIYKRIQRKYPYYYFVVDTKGWESSVRHNLIGNDAFKKNDETHLWSRVPGIELDAGKKRKATSPDQPSTAALHGYNRHYSPQLPPHGQALYHDHLRAQGYQGAGTPAAPVSAQQQPLATAAQASHDPAHGAPAQPGRQAYPLPPASAAAHYNPSSSALPRPLGAQQTTYNSPYASKPPPPVSGASGSPPSASAPARGPPFNGMPPRQTPPGGAPGPSSSTTPTQQPASAAAAAAATTNGTTPAPPLEPPVKPDVLNFINNFKKNVMEHLSKRTDQAEAVTLSVVNRGLGLADQSTVPEQEGIEKVVLGVFEQTRDKAYPNRHDVLPPGLVQVLNGFKTKWVDTLGTKLGKPKAEALLLSAIDRFLGFSERTTLRGSDNEKKEYENAENMLIPQLRKDVANYQRG